MADPVFPGRVMPIMCDKLKRIFRLGAIVSFFLLFFSACTKYERTGNNSLPGIALTFDDDRIDNWYSYLPFFDSAGIRATFYISNYPRLKTSQKNKLRELQNHGHEIAYHTVSHINMVEYVTRQHHTIKELLQNEIEAGLKCMQRDGFYPVSFAYPFGIRTGELDLALKPYFKSVRALNGSTDRSRSLAPQDKNYSLFGFGLDRSSNHTDDEIFKLLNSARNNNCVAVLVGHNINKPNKLSVSIDRLRYLVKLVQEMGLHYYTIREISD